MSQDSEKERVIPFKPLTFRKFICNLLLNVHSICINKWSHPICTKPIHQYYLNYQTIRLEYGNVTFQTHGGIKNIDDLLLYATVYNSIRIAKWCLKNNADVHCHQDEPLLFAASICRLKLVKLLVNAGADIHADNDYALRYAAYVGNLEIFKFFLNYGANIHSNNNHALRWSALFGQIEVVKLLLDAGADIHANNDEALKNAIKSGYSEIVDLLQNYKNENLLEV